MKTMNKITQDKIATAVLEAIKKEDLFLKEVAANFNFPRNYLTLIKRDNYFDKIPQKAWNTMRDWMYSGKSLKEFRSQIKYPVDPKEDTKIETESDIEKFKRELYGGKIIRIKIPGVQEGSNPELVQKISLEIEVSLKIKKD